MLNRYNSNIKSNKFIRQIINSKNLVNGDLTGSLLNIPIPSKTTFNSTSKKHIKSINKIFNTNSIENVELTASLQNIELPTTQLYNSTIKQNTNTTSIVNTKNTINNFHNKIFENSAMSIQVQIDAFDNEKNTLTIYNMNTDYGTEKPNSETFEVLVYGLQIPGDYVIDNVGNDVVITLNDRYIDFDNTTINDIYVIGKLLNISILTEDNSVITTEDGLDILL